MTAVEKEYFKRRLFGDGQDIRGKATLDKVKELPQTVSDSRGRFSIELKRGTYLLVARATSGNTVWASPATVNRDTEVSLAKAVCDAE